MGRMLRQVGLSAAKPNLTLHLGIQLLSSYSFYYIPLFITKLEHVNE